MKRVEFGKEWLWRRGGGVALGGVLDFAQPMQEKNPPHRNVLVWAVQMDALCVRLTWRFIRPLHLTIETKDGRQYARNADGVMRRVK